MRPALELRELRKAYGPLAVLHGVNLIVPTSKLVFIIGRGDGRRQRHHPVWRQPQ